MINRKYVFKIVFFSAAVALVHEALFSSVAFAHRPHDVVTAIRFAPFMFEGVTGVATALYIIVRNNLFRSLNKGKRWKRLVKGLNNFYPPSDLAAGVDGKNTTLLFSSNGDGIYRSIDGGSSWNKSNEGLPSVKILKVCFVPGSNQIAFAISEEGDLSKTLDGGSSWNKVFGVSEVTAIAFHNDIKDKILLGDRKGKIFVSDDCGESWNEFSFLDTDSIVSLAFGVKDKQGQSAFVGTKGEGLFKIKTDAKMSCIDKDLTDTWIRKIAVSSNRIFALGANEGLFVSYDEGNSWQKMVRGLTRDAQAVEEKYNSSHFIDMELSPDFLKDNCIFAGGFDGLFISGNGAKSWKEISSLPERAVVGLSVIEQEKKNNIAAISYMCSACLSEDGGDSWKNVAWDFKYPVYREWKIGINKFFIREPRFYYLVFSPDFKNDHTMFVSLIYGVFRSQDKGLKWKPVLQPTGKDNLVRCTVVGVSPDFIQDSTVFALTQQGHVYVSNDKGVKFKKISFIGEQKGNGSPSLVFSPQYVQDKTLFATGPKGVYVSKNAGVDWACCGDEKIEGLSDYRLAIAPDFSESRTLLVGTDRALFISNDAAQNWQQCQVVGGEDVWIKGIAFSPCYAQDSTFLVSVKGRGLYKTTDKGKSFKKIGDDSLLFGRLSGLESASMPIAFSPGYKEDNTIYAFGSPEAEYYRSIDGGETWETIAVPFNHVRLSGWLILLSRCIRFLPGLFRKVFKR